MEDLLNGGATPGYRWGQTLEEVTVHIDVGPGVRAKELVVDIKRTSVRVAKKAEPDAAPLLHGDLQQPVLASESTWMLSDGVLQLTRDAPGQLGGFSFGPPPTAADPHRQIPLRSFRLRFELMIGSGAPATSGDGEGFSLSFGELPRGAPA